MKHIHIGIPGLSSNAESSQALSLQIVIHLWTLAHIMMPVFGTPVHVTAGVTAIVSVLQWGLTLLNAVREELV